MNLLEIYAVACCNIRNLVGCERGFVISSELTLVATVSVIGLIVGVSSVRDAAISELSDVAGSVQDINQHYSINGINGHSAQTHGSDFIDATDFCDEPDDSANAIDNCVTFFEPSNESDDGTGGGGTGGGGTGGGGTGGGGNFGTPANGDLVSDNFQDGNGGAPFNLQVRNTTNATTGWTAVLASVPYATIPDLVPGDYTLTTTMNPGGTYQLSLIHI